MSKTFDAGETRLTGFISDMRPLGTARNGSSYIHFRLNRENGKGALFCSAFGHCAETAEKEFGNGCVVDIHGRFDRQADRGGFRFRLSRIETAA